MKIGAWPCPSVARRQAGRGTAAWLSAQVGRTVTYVPQFVLRNFSPDGGDAVPTFVLESGKFHEKSSVRGQCARDYFYGRSPEMENAFEQSETKVSVVLRRAATGDLVAARAVVAETLVTGIVKG